MEHNIRHSEPTGGAEYQNRKQHHPTGMAQQRSTTSSNVTSIASSITDGHTNNKHAKNNDCKGIKKLKRVFQVKRRSSSHDAIADGGDNDSGGMAGTVDFSRDLMSSVTSTSVCSSGSAGGGGARRGREFSASVGSAGSAEGLSNGSIFDNNGFGGGIWDLESCINVIESLSSMEGLTPHQQAAINNLRKSSFGGESVHSNKGRGGILSGSVTRHAPAQRREAKFFGMGRGYGSSLLNSELMKCFKEVESEEDNNHKDNVTNVLANFGGQIFDKVSTIAPRSERRHQTKKGLGLDTQTSIKEDEDSSTYDSDLGASLNLGELEMNRSSRRESRRDSRREGRIDFVPLDCTKSLEHLFKSDLGGAKVYCPPEWNALTKGARTKLTELLSWENLSRWDFNILEVADLTCETLCSPTSSSGLKGGQFCPLLFVGWAILCAPKAQEAMAGSLGDSGDDETELDHGSDPYCFVDDLKLDPECVCNFLRQIERGYTPDAPYHNNVHAADVTQTLHSILQYVGTELLEAVYDPIEVFSVLLAATFHDVGHQGTNNLYEKNSRTRLAIRYNDISILESMHSATGHDLLIGEKKRPEWDVFKQWTPEMIEKSRLVMVKAILGTDMSNHFVCCGDLSSKVEKTRLDDAEREPPREVASNGGDTSAQQSLLSIVNRGLKSDNDNTKKESRQLASHILKFMLHAADISNPTKERKLAVHWADRALKEFFAQGKSSDCSTSLF